MASIPFKGGHGTVSTIVFLEDRKKKRAKALFTIFNYASRKSDEF